MMISSSVSCRTATMINTTKSTVSISNIMIYIMSSMMILSSLYLIVSPTFVTPFVNAATAATTIPSSSLSIVISPSSSSLKQIPPHSKLETTSLLSSSSTDEYHHLRTTSITAYEKTNIISRLLFNYVVPILQIASSSSSTNRSLTIQDVIPMSIPDQNRESMTNATQRLYNIYHNLRSSSSSSSTWNQIQSQPHQLQSQPYSSINDTTTISSLSNTSTSLSTVKQQQPQNPIRLLVYAILLHQRRMIFITGILRLANTCIQAFPAILVSQLLRYIESSVSSTTTTLSTSSSLHHPIVYQSIRTSITLFIVLSIKMILENQYFYYIVQSSNTIKGSISGLLFQKSLQLQQGGSTHQYSSNAIVSTNTNTSSSTTTTNTATTATTATNGISSSSSSTLGVGGVINLMQSDTNIIESTMMQLHTIWDGPLQIMIYTSLLYKYLGSSIVYGMMVLLCTIPVNSIALRILNRLSKYENEARDARTKRTTESISYMKLLKLQGWEYQFADDIRFHRQNELRYYITRGFVRAMNSAISNAIPAIVLVVTLTAYVRTGRPIVASTIFTAISLFNQLRFPLFFYPLLIDSLANGRNAIRRITSFLLAEEITPYVQFMPPIPMKPSHNYYNNSMTGGCIEMNNGNFVWSVPQSSSIDSQENKIDIVDVQKTEWNNITESIPALVNVNIKVLPGEVVAVVGSVGSGKSALIKGLLGELHPVGPFISSSSSSGSDTYETLSTTNNSPIVISHGNIAYCSQEAWLPKGTIRDAILFGREYDECRYLKAIYDSGLSDDIDPLSTYGNDSKQHSKASGTTIPVSNGGPLSHNTDVGEGGSSLSGGQRARVALARALYSDDDTKVFLLDDCLAALDARVGSTVFDRMTQRLRASKAATILVTNDPSIPRRCDRVILMGNRPGSLSKGATVLDVGTYDELLSRGHDLRGMTISDEMEDPIQKIDLRYLDDPATIQYDAIASNDTALALPAMSSMNKPVAIVGSAVDESECCYTDCETQLTMQNCPDSIVDQVGVKRRDNNNDEYAFVRNVCVPDFQPMVNQTNIADMEGKVTSSKSSTANNPIPANAQDTQMTTTKQMASADDTMSTGAVPLSVYMLYLKSVGSPLLVVTMLASYLLSNGAQFFQQYTVAKWTEAGSTAIGSAIGLGYLQRLIYAAGVVSVFLWIRSILTMQVGVRASKFLHSKMLSSVFAAPMSFFDTTPSGQLLSRFGKEMETVDRAVPDSIGSVLFCFLQIFMSAGALAGILSSGMSIPLVLVAILYVRMMSRFRPAARDMKRIETKTRSPIYTNFGEAIRGSEVIRSIPGAKKYWARRHQSLFETNLQVYYTVKALDRWLSTRLETLGNVVVFAAAIASVILTRSGQIKAGSAGWGLTQALAITGLLTWAVRTLTDLESNMMSVLRVKELTDIDSETVDLTSSIGGDRKSQRTVNIPKEMNEPGQALVPLFSNINAAMNTTLTPMNSDALIQSGWPWQGNVQFTNVSMRYNPTSSPVLKNVTLSVPAGTTLGIVGRSGSGKSSLLLTLFRLVEIDGDMGSIQIDGVDIRSISISALRQSLAIIPQDPVLFSGTLAFNLDATGKASERDMIQALETASPELANTFQRANGLATVVSNSLLSVGERQLICLARALLRKSKILVLDEATSSVDSKTDQKVQETIRREFVDRGVTVITVAHRLDTVLAYDRIAVLGDGMVLEYGQPNQLIAIPGGELQKLVLADRLSKRKGSKKTAASSRKDMPTNLVSV